MSDHPKETAALARREPETLTTITTTDEFRLVVDHYRRLNYHVLSPVVDVGALPPQWALVRSIVVVNPDPASGDVYHDRLFCEQDEVALAKPALRRLLKAAGTSVHTEREDSATVPNYWAFKAHLSYMGLNGQQQEHEEGAEYDLRDGSPRINKMVATAKRKNRDPKDQIDGARMHGYRGCESRAIHAAARGQFGLKQKYKKEELEKPFVAFNLVFQPDMNDPEQRRLVTQAALGGAKLLGYPEPAALPPAVHAHENAIDIKPGREDSTGASSSSQQTTAPVERPFEDDEPPAKQDEDAVLVLSVTQAGDDYYVICDDNYRLHTKDREIARACNEARKAQRRLVIAAERRGDVMEILEILGSGGEKL